MKNGINTTFFIFMTVLSFAQSGQKWSLNGNTVSSGDFIGTTNNEPLILKSNNIVGLRLKPNGQLIIKSLDLNSSAPSGLVLTNGQGVISRLDFNTTTNQYLSSNGTWQVIPNGIWQNSANNLFWLGGNIGIGTSNPLFPLDVVGDARISNNLYVGGGVVISDKISAITEVKGWDFKVDNDINIEGASRLKGTVRLDQGFTFDGINGVSLINTTNGQVMRYGNKTAQILPLNCAAGPLSTSFTQQFGGAIQIFDNNNPTTSGLLNLQTWTGGCSIDASLAGNSQAGLLVNYFCGSNTFINTGTNGGIVSMGKIVEIGMPSTDPSVNLNIKTTNGSNTKAISIRNYLDNEVFYIGADGRTVINTQTIPSGLPASGLQINQNTSQAGIGIDIKTLGLNPSSINARLLLKDDQQTAILIQNESYPIGQNTRFLVKGNGATYIGSKIAFGNHSDALLSVYGKALFKSVYVSTSSSVWADYVFEKDYKLLPLYEVELYYKENKHLPGVPSAKEFEMNGINIVDNQAMLMKKIEELTIYVVELEKEIKKIKLNTN